MSSADASRSLMWIAGKDDLECDVELLREESEGRDDDEEGKEGVGVSM